MSDKLNEECGVFGVFGAPEAANLTYLGLHALQHRGQQAAGIVSASEAKLHIQKDLGLVGDVFSAARLAKLPGDRAIGHVRYGTSGSNGIKNAQPFAVDYGNQPIALAHNGHLVNAEAIRRKLEDEGAIFFSSSDTEVILHLIAREAGEPADRIGTALQQVGGAYSLLFLTEKQLIGVRDPRGFRPLILGKLKKGYVLASETCVLGLIDAEYLREVQPGEMVIIDDEGVRSFFPFQKKPHARCIFEHVYFARPDSIVFGQSVYASRIRMGEELAKQHPVEADLVIPVPDSGVPAAIGYAEQSGIPFGMGLVRSHYVGRTFIEPSQSIRHFGVRLKLSALGDVLRDKRIVVVDDSIVRGTTSRKIVKMLRAAGAKEVHFRVSSPPTSWPCFYGIDTPNRKELIGASHTEEEITRYITADTLGYLAIERLRAAVGSEDGAGFCDACFTGRYPERFPNGQSNGTRHLKVVEG